MNKFLKSLKISLLIILGGLVVPALLSIIFSGFRVNIVSIVSFEFFVGIIIAVTGGILIAYDNSALRKKVLKTPLDQEVEEDKEPDKMNWSYVLFCSGLVIVLVAIALGEI
ncbi:MAG: hypothetical protein K0Q65_2713 [Clostridia bacterium]|jgi:hypothetical protein|nr:hypothetical protein [Clostridia bacterium]